MRLTEDQITTELRELRPTASEEFSAELDAWAEAGFPKVERKPHRSPRRRPWIQTWLPQAAVVVLFLAVIAVPVALVGGGSEHSDDSGTQGSGDVLTDQAAQPESGGAGQALEKTDSGSSIAPDPTTVPPIPPQDQKLRPGKERVQEKSAAMTLSTDPDEVQEVADEVVEVVERYDGIVLSSNISVNDEKGRASFDLRVPTANLQATLADLSDLASVASRDEGTLDITSPFVTAEERFQDAKASVDALLEQLSEADTSSEIAALREQLIGARAELAAARSELGALKQRADFSRLSLTVVGDGDADGWSIGDAADDAVSVLEDIAGAGLIALAVIIPLGGLAILAWFGLNRFRRRQAERALDE